MKQVFLSASLLWSLLCSPLVQAHLMVAQQGTLNIIGNDVFMVLSLPVSAFTGVDDDDNGHISLEEINQHLAEVTATISSAVQLQQHATKLVLQDILLSPVLPHHGETAPLSQLTVMGKFTLPQPQQTFALQMTLFGHTAAEQRLKMTISRQVDQQKQSFELTPKVAVVQVFADQ